MSIARASLTVIGQTRFRRLNFSRRSRADPRTNVGERLLEVRVLRTDASGRAELIAIEGDRRLTVKGWDFKIIVGRALGWNLLKSSRFTVARSGSNFVFRGSGFGHGLGLCQEGAHVMAKRGASYRQILARYFPGTDVARETDTASQYEAPGFGDSFVTQTVSLRSLPEMLPRVSWLLESIGTSNFADLLWNSEPRSTPETQSAILGSFPRQFVALSPAKTFASTIRPPSTSAK